MAKGKNDYFKLAETQISHCVQAANLLEKILCNYSTGLVETYRAEMHEIEHRADEVHHDILSRLSGEFITPMDQEDILRLVQIVDDITDALDEVVLECYMYHIEEAPIAAPTLVKIVNRCVSALSTAICELKNFKKPEMLRLHLISVNTIEGEADAAYAMAIHDLFSTSDDVKRLLGAKAIYESLEDCCDLCEHAADVIDQIIIKNA